MIGPWNEFLLPAVLNWQFAVNVFGVKVAHLSYETEVKGI